MSNALSDATQRELALKLWVAAAAEEPMAAGNRTRETTLAQMHPCNAFELAGAVAGSSADAPQMVKASEQAAREMGLEGDGAPRGGPRNKMARIAARAKSLEEIQRFAAMSGRTNVLRSCELSLKSVAPGIRCCVDFSELAGRERFFPSEEAVLARSAYVSAGSAFQISLLHLEKACILLGYSL